MERGGEQETVKERRRGENRGGDRKGKEERRRQERGEALARRSGCVER